MVHQRIEQLLRQAFASGLFIQAWIDGESGKWQTIPENLLEDTLTKFMKDHEDSICKLAWIGDVLTVPNIEVQPMPEGEHKVLHNIMKDKQIMDYTINRAIGDFVEKHPSFAVSIDGCNTILSIAIK